MAVQFYIDNDHQVRVTDLKDQDGNVETTAAVQAKILDAAGNMVANGGPITLSHTSNGEYVGSISKDLGIKENRKYTLEITADTNTAHATFRPQFTPRQRIG